MKWSMYPYKTDIASPWLCPSIKGNQSHQNPDDDRDDSWNWFLSTTWNGQWLKRILLKIIRDHQCGFQH